MTTINNNIVSSFFKRALFSIIFISLISSVSIYYFQQYTFYTSIGHEIKAHIEEKLQKYDQSFSLSDQKSLEHDLKSIMEELGFIIIELYDNKQVDILTFASDEKMYEQKLNLLIEHDIFVMHNFPKDSQTSYDFFEVEKRDYFLQVFYPIYRSGELLGYIEGISYIDPNYVLRFKRGIFASITITIFTIIVFSLLIFPLIYFAYKKLNTHRLELLSSNIMMINTLGNAIALRDNDTDEHNYRVTLYAIKFAQSIDLDYKSIQKLIKGAFLHDIGKIGISDNILLKNGNLDEDEFNIMRSHVNKGIQLVHNNSWLKDAEDVILYHHEEYSGNGYPNGVKGENIPLIARIFIIVDVFDALNSKRPYKEPFPYEESITILKESSNIHFDAVLLDKFFKISSRLYLDINQQNRDELRKELDTLIKKYFLD